MPLSLHAANHDARDGVALQRQTMRVAACVPPENIDWTYREGRFTLGDVMRHLGAIERWMFAENAQRRPSAYPGHGREPARRPRGDRHEVHHRGQIYLYLAMLEIPTPPLYGLTEEEVKRRSAKI